jgi:hypothetical protein
LYDAVKSDPILANYPVWSISEPGAQLDNVGLQFLEIPTGAKTLMPDGTKYADYANLHNYIYHPNSPRPIDNKTWNAANPTSKSMVDGLYGNFGVTWRRGFMGYTQEQLNGLPRVTTETGATVGGAITEEIHALNLLTMYLAQFKQGFAYTAVYLLRDRTDEGGNQSFGFFKPDYTPRKAAEFLSKFTRILADKGSAFKAGSLDFSITPQPRTVHDLLLQRSDETFQLIIWGERLSGEDDVEVRFGSKHALLKIFDPTKSIKPSRVLTNVDSLRLNISNHPFIIEIPPKKHPEGQRPSIQR